MACKRLIGICVKQLLRQHFTEDQVIGWNIPFYGHLGHQIKTHEDFPLELPQMVRLS